MDVHVALGVFSHQFEHWHACSPVHPSQDGIDDQEEEGLCLHHPAHDVLAPLVAPLQLQQSAKDDCEAAGTFWHQSEQLQLVSPEHPLQAGIDDQLDEGLY